MRLLPCLSLPLQISELKRKSESVGISSVSPGFVSTIIAEKKGLYGKYGLRSEHVIISLAVAINAVRTGDLDCVVSVAQGVSAALRGFPVKLVMMTEDKLDFFRLTNLISAAWRTSRGRSSASVTQVALRIWSRNQY